MTVERDREGMVFTHHGIEMAIRDHEYVLSLRGEKGHLFSLVLLHKGQLQFYKDFTQVTGRTFAENPTGWKIRALATKLGVYVPTLFAGIPAVSRQQTILELGMEFDRLVEEVEADEG